MNSEIWKPVVSYENFYKDFYKVSDEGNTKSLDRITRDGRHLKGCHLKQVIGSNGYLTICLSCGGHHRTVCVHKLVCETFIGPRPVGYEVCHGVGGKLDNRLENLRYGTGSENSFDQYRDGTMTLAKPIKCSDGEIYRSISQAGRDTGISNSNIRNVLKGRQKTAGGFHWEYI